jgi:hypothetical protein
MIKVQEIKESMTNQLILKKLPSDTVTMMQIKNQIRKMISEGIKLIWYYWTTLIVLFLIKI